MRLLVAGETVDPLRLFIHGFRFVSRSSFTSPISTNRPPQKRSYQKEVKVLCTKSTPTTFRYGNVNNSGKNFRFRMGVEDEYTVHFKAFLGHRVRRICGLLDFFGHVISKLALTDVLCQSYDWSVRLEPSYHWSFCVISLVYRTVNAEFQFYLFCEHHMITKRNIRSILYVKVYCVCRSHTISKRVVGASQVNCYGIFWKPEPVFYMDGQF